VSGYLGSKVCHDFLLTGKYNVRGTVRDKTDESKLGPLRKAYGELFDKLELVNANLLDAESIDLAIAGANIVVHTASPFVMKVDNQDELIKPAVDGTVAVMKACHKHKIERCVITSSVAAILSGWKDEEKPKKWTEEHWSKVDRLNEQPTWYMKSKLLAEEAAWKFREDLPEAERFDIVTINPGLIMGPVIWTGTAFTSGKICVGILEKHFNYLPPMSVVDIRDVS
jgi:nucleoside-diphosphate-sugar epimerase